MFSAPEKVITSNNNTVSLRGKQKQNIKHKPFITYYHVVKYFFLVLSAR